MCTISAPHRRPKSPPGTALAAVIFAVLAFPALPARAQTRSFNYQPTGNGHGFQVFDLNAKRITSFLEHPYSFVGPLDDNRKGGIRRRELAFDMYLGARRTRGVWLDEQTDLEYEAETHIIHGTSTQDGLGTDTYYFAPFGYAGNGMVMLIRARNDTGSAVNAKLYAKANLKLGFVDIGSRDRPGDEGEDVQWNGSADPPHGIETGPGGGHAIIVPIGGVNAAGCAANQTIHSRIASGSGDIGGSSSCNGNDQVLGLQRNVTIDAGGEAWWGVAILFVNDNPTGGTAAQRSQFEDNRSVADILAAWRDYAGSNDAEAVHDAALTEFEAFRQPDWMPPGLTGKERRLWRQSEAVLRMGQIRERGNINDGMFLAALPPGGWHIGWVRDGAYAISAAAITGHHELARLGLEFLLGAEASYFSGPEFLGKPYRISATRYYGNGVEEGDWSDQEHEKGYNVEMDGWGLFLWAARMYLHYSCNLDWLDQQTWHGDTVYDALEEVAEDIAEQIVGDLPGTDTSIWEVHWKNRKVFTFTAVAQIRAMFDFGDIAEARGETATAERFRGLAQNMLDKTKQVLVYQPDQSIASNLVAAGNPVHVNGSTVEMLLWGMVNEADPIYEGTLANYSRLLTAQGGYARLEPTLSIWSAGKEPGTYDLSEWILLDLRIGEAWRRFGKQDLADALLDKVTDVSAANNNLIAELYEPTNGNVEGSTPMVGYGAGAWMMAQIEKTCGPAAAYDAGFAHCASGEPFLPCAEIDIPDPEDPEDPEDGPIDDGPASLCAASRDDGAGASALVLAFACGLALRRRRHN